jgi:hypothetical protein
VLTALAVPTHTRVLSQSGGCASDVADTLGAVAMRI